MPAIAVGIAVSIVIPDTSDRAEMGFVVAVAIDMPPMDIADPVPEERLMPAGPEEAAAVGFESPHIMVTGPWLVDEPGGGG